MIGGSVGGFTLVKKLGSGGMGEVYLAEHNRIDRKVALKVLLPSVSSDPDQMVRFFKEARATSLIKHPGIVEVYDCDLDGDRGYLAMELLTGESLAAAIDRSGSFASEISSVAAVVGKVADALAAAHDTGIIHRDLKPANIFLVPTGDPHAPLTVKILDFGIAKLTGKAAGLAPATQPGMIVGTPLYMSPEQCRNGSQIDQRSDIYSLGCVMFEMLTGQPPFMRQDLGSMLAAHLHEPVPLPSSREPWIPEAIDDLVARMLAKEPVMRLGSMREVIARLEDFLGVKLADFAAKIPPTTRMLPSPTVVEGAKGRITPRWGVPSPFTQAATPVRPMATVPSLDAPLPAPSEPTRPEDAKLQATTLNGRAEASAPDASPPEANPLDSKSDGTKTLMGHSGLTAETLIAEAFSSAKAKAKPALEPPSPVEELTVKPLRRHHKTQVIRPEQPWWSYRGLIIAATSAVGVLLLGLLLSELFSSKGARHVVKTETPAPAAEPAHVEQAAPPPAPVAEPEPAPAPPPAPAVVVERAPAPAPAPKRVAEPEPHAAPPPTAAVHLPEPVVAPAPAPTPKPARIAETAPKAKPARVAAPAPEPAPAPKAARVAEPAPEPTPPPAKRERPRKAAAAPATEPARRVASTIDPLSSATMEPTPDKDGAETPKRKKGRQEPARAQPKFYLLGD